MPIFDNNRHQVEIRAREDVMTYGTTMGRTGVRGFGMPIADPRLCTPSHGRSQYYMNALDGNGATATGQYYHDDATEDERHQQQPPSVHMMNYMNDLDAAMTRPIAYPQYDGEEEAAAAAHGYYPQQPHLMSMMMNGSGVVAGCELDGQDVDPDPYNHMQNFEHVMHRKESHDRRVEDELWQGVPSGVGVMGGGMQEQQQFFVSQSQLAGPEYRRGDTLQSSGTHGRTRRKKANGGGSHYQMGGEGRVGGIGSAASSSYNVHGELNGEFPMEVAHRMEGRHRGDEPIYEEIMSNHGGRSITPGGSRQNPNSRHLSAFLNEKSNSVISCLEPIK